MRVIRAGVSAITAKRVEKNHKSRTLPLLRGVGVQKNETQANNQRMDSPRPARPRHQYAGPDGLFPVWPRLADW